MHYNNAKSQAVNSTLKKKVQFSKRKVFNARKKFFFLLCAYFNKKVNWPKNRIKQDIFQKKKVFTAQKKGLNRFFDN